MAEFGVLSRISKSNPQGRRHRSALTGRCYRCAWRIENGTGNGEKLANVHLILTNVSIFWIYFWHCTSLYSFFLFLSVGPCWVLFASLFCPSRRRRSKMLGPTSPGCRQRFVSGQFGALRIDMAWMIFQQCWHGMLIDMSGFRNVDNADTWNMSTTV